MKRKVERISIIGVGSSHADDQFGWLVVDQLAKLAISDVILRKVSKPIDLLPDLEESDRVVVIDAASGLDAASNLCRLDFSNPVDRSLIELIPSRGTHDVGLFLVLRMAESLNKRSDHVTIWLGNGRLFDRFGPTTPAIDQAVGECVTAVVRDINHARNVAC